MFFTQHVCLTTNSTYIHRRPALPTRDSADTPLQTEADLGAPNGPGHRFGHRRGAGHLGLECTRSADSPSRSSQRSPATRCELLLELAHARRAQLPTPAARLPGLQRAERDGGEGTARLRTR
eukprot:scaffold1085_cov407-Prasinococcus_capsulatus_cf.AAC.65